MRILPEHGSQARVLRNPFLGREQEPDFGNFYSLKGKTPLLLIGGKGRMTDKRLLIVDDLPALGEVVSRVAGNMGYEVRVTTHAEDFKRDYDNFDPTTVVLDIVMPDVDGIELIGWLIERKCDAKILVASAYNPDYARMAETLGTAKGLKISFIEKPYRVSELRTSLA
jgi:DNA-binding NtrC family response regulator